MLNALSVQGAHSTAPIVLQPFSYKIHLVYRAAGPVIIQTPLIPNATVAIVDAQYATVPQIVNASNAGQEAS